MNALRMHKVEIGQKRLLQGIPQAEDCDQELPDGVSEYSYEDVHDSIVIDMEDEAYDNCHLEHIDPLSQDQIS